MLTALALVLAVAAPAAPAAAPAAGKPAVMSFAVQPGAKAGPAGQQWAQELKAALEARKDEFRPARTGEKPELVMRIDSVGAAPKGGSVMNGSLAVGPRTSPFNLTYVGESRVQAEKLARHLRRLAEQMKAAPPAPAPAKK